MRLTIRKTLKRSWLAALAVVGIGSTALAAPIEIDNASFEAPDLSEGATWTNDLTDAWTNPNAAGTSFIERIPGFSSKGAQHVGTENGGFIFQKTAVAAEPNTTYTLIVGVGNRAANFSPEGAMAVLGLTVLDGDATLSAATANEQVAADEVLTATSILVPSPSVESSFEDRTLSFTTGAEVPPGNITILLGDDASAGRSHFDNVRLYSQPAGTNIDPESEFQTAALANNTIVLDGDLSEWNATPIVNARNRVGGDGLGELVPFEPFGGGTWDGPEDHSNVTYLTYDADNVYVGIIVTDDYHEHAAEGPGGAWNGDAVQLHVTGAARDTQGVLRNFALQGVEGALGEVVIHFESPTDADGSEAVITREGTTTTYEIKIPKEVAGLDVLEPGVQLGIGMTINDGDEAEPGQKGWGGLGTHSIVYNGKTPSETALVTLGAPFEQVWTVGLPGDAWPQDGTGGGAMAVFVQEAGVNELPGDPANPVANQQSDDDYYFAGVYDTVLDGGAYTPIGAVAANEEGAERAFAGDDVSLRYHFNLPSGLGAGTPLAVSWDANNLHEADQADPRWGVEVYFNGVLVGEETIIRPGQLGLINTTPSFTLADVGGEVGEGFDNYVELRGINYSAEGGGNWMGIDHASLAAGPSTGGGGDGLNIAFVSFHDTDAPSADAAAADPPITEASDIGYTNLLTAQGHNVTRVLTSGGRDDADFLNGFDLIIISRAVNSGDYGGDANAAFWNTQITAPVMNLGGYTFRNSRLNWTDGGTMVDTDGPVSLSVAVADHPVFAGVDLSGPYANFIEGERGVSFNTDNVVGGTVLATAADTTTAGGAAIFEFAVGAEVNNGNVIAGPRLAFLTGSRELGRTSQTAGFYDLTAAGEHMFLNAVNYMGAGAGFEFTAPSAAVAWGDVNADTTAADLLGGGTVTFTPMVIEGNGNAEGEFYTQDGSSTGNAELDAVYNSHSWNAAGFSIVVDGLTPGTEYQIQFLGAGDTRGCCNTRTQTATDQQGNLTAEFPRGNSSVIGTFTAIGTSETFTIAGETDPGLSGYILADANGVLAAVNIARPADGEAITVEVPVDLSALLKVHYEFEEGAGAIVQNLVNEEAPAFPAPTYFNDFEADGNVAGAPGSSTPAGGFNFPADNSGCIETGVNVESLLAGGGYTMSAWMKPSDVSGQKVLFGQTSQGIHNGIRNDSFLHNAHWGNDHNATTTVVADEWIHATWVYDGDAGTSQIYLNGVVDRDGVQAPPNVLAADLILGNRDGCGGGEGYVGDVDDIAIWGEPFTAEQVAQLASGASPVVTSGSSANLIAHFPLDADGNSADGAFVASTATDVTFDGAGANAATGTSAVFNGTSSLIQHDWSADLNPESFTLALWAKSDGGAGAWNSPVTSRRDLNPDSEGYLIYDNEPGGVWTFWSGNGTAEGNWQALDGPAVNVGAWDHVAITYDNASQMKRMYINGELAAESADSITPNGATPFNIGAGADFGGTFHFVGEIDDIGLWDGALDAAAIQNVMNNGVAAEAGDGGGNDNVVHGMITTTNANVWRVGNESDNDTLSVGGPGYMYFDSANGAEATYIDTGMTPADLGIEGAPYTMMARVRQDEIGTGNNGDSMIFGQTSGEVLHNGARGDQLHIGHWGSDHTGGSVSLNEWRHVTFVFDGADHLIYVDGTEVTRSTSGDKTGLGIGNKSKDTVLIGITRPDQDRDFIGCLDDVRIYCGALTQGQIASIACESPRADCDGDGIPDSVELAVFGTLDRDGTGDFDGDRLNDATEYALGTDMDNRDTDNDLVWDSAEVWGFYSDPLVQDSDGDGLRDDAEAAAGTDPTSDDTDRDGIADGDELNSPYQDVTAPGDAIVRVDGVNDDDGNAGAPPAGEVVTHVIDDVAQKYLNFLDLGSGFIVTPSSGASVVSALRFYAANDAPNRDPASFEIAGSNAGPDGPFEVIASGSIELPDDRNDVPGDTPLSADLVQQQVSFSNRTAYTSYRVIFPTLKNAGGDNSMQIAEVELLARSSDPLAFNEGAIAAGLKVHYDFSQFDEADGNLVANLGNGPDGTLVAPEGVSLRDVAETDLSTPTMTWTEVGQIPSINNQFDGADQLDGTFRALIDFDAKTEGNAENIWESGGATIGTSFVYEAPSTLALRTVGMGGNAVLTTKVALSQADIDAGTHEVIWTIDVNPNGPEVGSIWINGVLAASSSFEKGNDWSGGDAMNILSGTPNLSAGGGNTNLPGGSSAFASGTVDLDTGIQFFRDTLFQTGVLNLMGGTGADAVYVDTNLTPEESGASGTDYTMLARVQLNALGDGNNNNNDSMIFGTEGGEALHNGMRNDRYHQGHWGNDQTGGSVELGAWVDVAWRYTASQQTIYVNGDVVAASGGKGALDGPLADLGNVIIGTTRTDQNRDFNGLIDNVSIYCRALSHEAIRDIQGSVRPVAERLLVHYEFEQGISMTVENTGNAGAPDGALNSLDVISAYGSGSPSAGGPGYMNFDSTPNADATYIDTGLNPASAGIMLQPYTMTAWVRQTEVGDGNNSDAMVFGQLSGEVLHNGARGTQPYFGHWGDDVGGGSINLGQWTHYAWTFDGDNAPGTIAIYQNGELIASDTKNGLGKSDANIIIGTTNLNDNRDFVGQLDDVRIYQGVLSTTEIAEVAGLVDSDGDGLLDSFERAFFGNLAMGGAGDPDMDGINNADEERLGLDPTVSDAQFADADGDGWTLGDETDFGTNDNNPANFPSLFVGGGQWEVRTVQAAAGFTGLDAALALLDGQAEAASDETTFHDFINFGAGNNGLIGGDEAFPGGAADHFVTHAKADIEVTVTGEYIFSYSTDDGMRILVNGEVIGEVDAGRGAPNQVIPYAVTLAAGRHTVELIQYEQTGGDAAEFGGTISTANSLNGLGGGTVVLVPAAGEVDPNAPPAGLLAYWDFNGEGDPVDLVNGTVAVLTDGAAYGEGPGGAGDGAIDFGTTSESQRLDVDPSILTPIAATDSFTVSFWQNLHAVANSSSFWVDSAVAGDRALHAHTPWGDGNIYFDTAGCCAANQRLSAAGGVTAGTWQHFAFVKDGPFKAFYVDGVEITSGDGFAPIPEGFFAFHIGSQNEGVNSVQGIIDEFSIWSVALNPGEIADLAAGAKAWEPAAGGGGVAGLLGYWPDEYESTADNHLDLGTIPAQTLDSEFSWSFWSNAGEGNGPNNTIFGNRYMADGTDFDPREFIKFTPTKFEWHYNAGGDENVGNDDTVIPVGEWVHNLVVKDGATITYYRNGAEVASGAITGAPVNEQPLFLGGVPGTDGATLEGFIGSLKEAATFDRALSPADVMDVYNRGVNGESLAGGPETESVLVWTVGLPGDGWPADLGEGGGPETIFVQEAGVNELPGDPASPVANQQSDDDYYFAGVYDTVLDGGTYTPVGVVAQNEIGAERAFAGDDASLRYHFNFPSTIMAGTPLSVSWDATNLHEADQADPRWGVEVYVNGTLVGEETVIRPAELGQINTTASFTLADVGGEVGEGFDNYVELRGINYSAEGGGNWMGIDHVSLSAELPVPSGPMPIAHWPLDEIIDGVSPDVAGDRHMTATNLTDADIVSGRHGNAIAFDAARQTLLHYTAADGEATATSNPAYTIAFWTNTKGTGQNDLRLFSEASTSSGTPLFNLGTANDGSDDSLDLYLRTQDNGNPYNHPHTAGMPLDGNWHHIAFTQEEGGQIAVYIDGVADPIDTSVLLPEFGGGINTTSIGGILRAAPSHWVTGVIDDVKIWDVALTAEEVAAEVGPADPRAAAVAKSSGPLTEPTLVNFGDLSGDASYEFSGSINKVGGSTAIAGNDAGALKWEQWQDTGFFGATVFGVADHVSDAPTVLGEEAHVVFVNDTTAGETRIYVNGALAGTAPGVFELTGEGSVLGAVRADGSFLDPVEPGSVLHGWATYNSALSADEVAALAAAPFGGGGGPSGPAPLNIAFVSFHAADDMPTTAAADAGYAEATDKGYTDALTAAGHTVTRFEAKQDPTADDAAILNAADLVIVSRAVSSNMFQQEAEFWNTSITVPLMNLGGYTYRSSRLNWTDGGDMVDADGPVTLTVENADHPIFAGVDTSAPYANGLLEGQRGLSFNNNTVVGGTLLASAADTSVAGAPAIFEFASGATVNNGNVLAAPRLAFLTGSREFDGVSSETSGIWDLTDSGAQMFHNAVNYLGSGAGVAAQTSSVKQLVDSDRDGTADVLERLAGTDANDPSDYFHISGIAPAESGLMIEFEGVEGHVYEIEFSQDLSEGSWQVVGSQNADETAPVEFLHADKPEGQGFYRARVVQD